MSTDPFGDRPEHGLVVELLECLALFHFAGNLADKRIIGVDPGVAM